MGNTEKVSSSVKGLKNALEINNHRLVNQLTQGIAKKIRQIHPDLVVIPMGKKMSESEISLSIRGEVYCEDEQEAKNTQIKVENFINGMQESDIKSLLGDD